MNIKPREFTKELFNKKTTTLNFEGNTIRCLTLSGRKVTAWENASLPQDQMSQGVIHLPEEVSKKVTSLLGKTKAATRNLITGITDQRSIHRLLSLPAIDENLLDETVQRKAKQEFALPIDEVDISWQIVKRTQEKLKVYVLAIPKEITDSQVETLAKANLKPKVMDTKPLALIRAVNQANSLIVNLEEYSMAVIIVVDGLPVIVRTVPLESGDLTAEAKLDLLSQELARTTKFYNESNKENRLPENTPLYTTGTMFNFLRLADRLTNSSPLRDRLQERTPYPLQVLKPNLETPKILPPAEYAVNIGLALKVLR
ncbi:MAG: pilus assembly protein PilM [Anaerolineales bacterium]|nr:pilus assembly protein PilM [Anaerolineales bacterium]